MSHADPRPLRVSAGQPPIFQPGDTGTVWRVRQGVVRLNRPAGAGRLPVQLALPGDLIGIEALCDQPYQFCAEAFTDCELEPVPLGTAAEGDTLRQALLREVLLQQQSRSQDMATLRTGSVLLSNEGNALMTIVASAVEYHDTIGGACSCESNTLRYGHHTRHQHACVDNFLEANLRQGRALPIISFAVRLAGRQTSLSRPTSVPLREPARQVAPSAGQCG